MHIRSTTISPFAVFRLCRWFGDPKRPGKNPQAARKILLATGLFLTALILLASASPSAAQKDKKKKKEEAAAESVQFIPLADDKQIDYAISEMLGAWQIGDVEKLHKDYADDVSVVAGTWTPPVIGWTNYLAIYQQQRARMQQVRLDRYNTYIKIDEASHITAWVSYQWDFEGVVDGQSSVARGQTTLVLAKRNNHWVIVHNHTSLVDVGKTATAPAGTAPSAQPTVKP